ncbi:MAG: MaoC family dehydratase N-terminal domain-containing protein [Clostridia bacterium]|nr:MaoC family dehydratase N-terminal domain-containing protein [Clostridia bacterium]
MFFEELQQGMTRTLLPVTVEREEMLDFAKKYDNVPLHTDEAAAAKTPFGRLLAPGVLSFLLVWAKYLEQDFFGEQLLAGTSTTIEWLRLVFAEDVLTGTAQVTKLQERSPRSGLATLELRAFNQNGEHVLTGTVCAVIKRKNT